ncbi:hypothetical protein ABRQ22_16725 [Cellulosimicrobium sp. ES-005]|uniref:Lipoprotein n=1 Tax=Cellulosimicrobium sp. ES-005 TaxID=3163031 RepID=A0AAU8FX74_9MICO
MRFRVRASLALVVLVTAACGAGDDGTRQAEDACALAAADLAMADDPEDITPAQVAEDKSNADRARALAASAAKRNPGFRELSLAASEAARWYEDLQDRLAVNLAPMEFGQAPRYLPLADRQPDTLEGFDLDARSLEGLDAECQIVTAE